MGEALSLIDTAKATGADVSFDLYPYTSTASVLYTFLPEWLTRGGKRFFMERLKAPSLRRRAIQELQEKHLDYAKATLLLSTLNTVTTRQNIAEMAAAQHVSPEEILLNLLVAGNGRAIVSWDTISEENIEREMVHSLSLVSSNGVGYAKEHCKSGESIHPRNFGAMPRFLGTYVRERHLLEWEAAIHKITGAPAERLGLSDRGIIREGVPADIVVFQPDEIAGMSTFDQPYRSPRGISSVIVSGEAALLDHQPTGTRTGQVIRRPHSWFSW
jgi:N-acyl-D-aspartate/D-glutamate deacylase